MSKFLDKLGREWHLEINIAAMRRAKSKGIDLSMVIKQLAEFIMDDVFLCDALWAIVKPGADEQGVTQEQFEAGLDGTNLELAREALWKALEAYYALGKSQMLSAAIASVKAEMAKATADLISIGSTKSKAN